MSPISFPAKDDVLVVLKSYLDGGNTADSKQFKIITLASVSANPSQWTKFEKEWNRCLRDHGAEFLHTTDAVSRKGAFSHDKGWTKDKAHVLISDCVSIIEKHAAVREGKRIVRHGVRPATTSVILEDFNRAVKSFPAFKTSENICAIQTTGFCFWYGLHAGGKNYDDVRFQLFFDRGEHFYGHIHDRMTNRKSRHDDPFWERVIHCGETDMRYVPGLQAADLLAWALNRSHEDGLLRYKWQERLLVNIDRDKEWFDYELLMNPKEDVISRVESWKLPKRRAPG